MSKPRSNSSGSVTRRGRSYWIRYSGSRDPLTGKRRRICETIKVATEQEAWNEITKRRAAILDLCMDAKKLEATPVHEFVDMMAA